MSIKNSKKRTWILAFARMTEDKKAFTLIELMVSVALFSIVVMISMTAILSVVDSTKKAQSMKSVMNNLNFALETMTRSIKTGKQMTVHENGASVTVVDQTGLSLEYTSGTVTVNSVTSHNITRNGEAITAPEVSIDTLKFYDGTILGGQPSVVMVVQGTVKLTERTSSVFNIQTTITQRVPGGV